MEIFVDGGLFELLIALSLGYLVNVIFLKKYLLILYSAVAIGAPAGMFFLSRGDLFFFLAGLCVLNAVLLAILLWRQRVATPGKPLFDLQAWKKPWQKKRNQSPSYKS